MKIILKASDVAAIIGRNPYKPRSDILTEYWKKYSPQTFTGKTTTDRANEALDISPVARTIMNSAVSVKARDSTEAARTFEAARVALSADTSLSETQRAEVIDHVRSKVYTSHGTRSEDRTSTKVMAETGARLVRDNSFYNLDVAEINGHTFMVRGVIDRIEEKPDGSRVLVEIKNRMNRLFKRVVDYEMIQVQVYLQMLGLVHARLVEQYNSQVMSHDIDRDEEMVQNEIMPGLKDFCAELAECIGDDTN